MLLGEGPIQQIFKFDSKKVFPPWANFYANSSALWFPYHSVNLNPKPVHGCKFSSDLFILIPGESFFSYFSVPVGEPSRMKPSGCQLYAVGSHFQLPAGHGPKSYFLYLCVH